jgi:acyl-CoA thioesterase FadM
MTLYFRLLLVWLTSLWKPRLGMHDVLELPMRVLPNDLDLNVHLSNARYLSVLDLGVIAILVRSRFMKAIRSLGAFPMEGGVMISYRSQIHPFARYRLRLWYLGCDEYWHVFAFAFVRADGRLAAKGLVKGGAVRRAEGLVRTQEIWERYTAQTGEPVRPPPLPAYARDWLAAERAAMDHMMVRDPVADEAFLPTVTEAPRKG